MNGIAMPLRITTNVPALTAQRNLARIQTGVGRSLERLSSGYRINRAADDAAGLAISEKLRANVGALQRAGSNAADALAYLQVVDSTLATGSDLLLRMVELASEAATGTVNTEERGFLNTEFCSLRDGIDRLKDTRYNDTRLIASGQFGVRVQVGIDDQPQSTVSLTVTMAGVDLDAAALDTPTHARDSLALLTHTLDLFAGWRAEIGAFQNRLESIQSGIANHVENLTAAESRIRDMDVASETAALAKSKILVQAGVSVLAQANASPSLALQLLS